MSLMNDVLQQLDLRHPREANTQGFAPLQLPVTPPVHAWSLGKLGVAALCLIFGVSIGRWFHGANFQTVTQAASNIVVETPVAEAAPNGAAQLAAVVQEQTTVVTPETATNATNLVPDQIAIAQEKYAADAIAALLQEANNLLAADKLMQPIGNCAFTRFRQVLLVDPDNALALAGLESIKKRYQVLFADELAQRNFQKAKTYLVRMSVAGVEPDALQQMSSRLQELRKAASLDTAAQPAESTGLAVQYEPVVNTQINDALTPFNLEATEPVASVEPAPNTLGGRAQADQQLAKQALNGSLLKPKEALLNYINTHGVAPESEFALAQLYCNEKDGAALQALIARSDQLSPSRKAFLRAKWFLIERDYASAAAALDTQVPEPKLATEYRRLQAAALQNNLQYARAAELYQQLLEQQPTNGNLWLGFAVCEDAQNHSASALAAFKRAYTSGGQDPSVQAYLRERISALSN